MSEEEKNEESVATESDVPASYTKAMDTIESEMKDETESVAEAETEVSEEGTVSEKTETTAEAEETQEETLKDIDPEVLGVCRDYGWDDEKIAKIKDVSPELLDDIREVLDEEQKEAPAGEKKVTEEPKVKEPEVKFDEFKFDLDPDIVGEEVKGAIDKVVARLNEQQKGLSEEKSRLKSDRDAAFNVRIESCFDGHTKELMVEAKESGDKAPSLDLGNSSKLNRQQKGIRHEIYAHAYVTSQIKRVPIEKAIEIEIDRYRNSGGDKAAEQRLLNKLDKQKKRFTHPPTRKNKASSADRKFTTEEERIRFVMDEAHKKAGIE